MRTERTQRPPRKRRERKPRQAPKPCPAPDLDALHADYEQRNAARERFILAVLAGRVPDEDAPLPDKHFAALMAARVAYSIRARSVRVRTGKTLPNLPPAPAAPRRVYAYEGADYIGQVNTAAQVAEAIANGATDFAAADYRNPAP